MLENRSPEASGRTPEGLRRPRRPPGGSQEALGAGNHAKTTYFTRVLGGPGGQAPGSGRVIVTRFGPGGGRADSQTVTLGLRLVD